MKDSLNPNGAVWHFCDFLGRRVVDPGDTPWDEWLTWWLNSASRSSHYRSHPRRTHKSRRHLSWTWVEEMWPDSVKVAPGPGLPFRADDFGWRIPASQGLLDKQIVDTAGAKVVRINDLHLHRRNGNLVLARVDVGMRGLLRRLGLLRVTAAVIQWLFGYTLPDNLIAWRLVQPVGSQDILRLKFRRPGWHGSIRRTLQTS